jgi:hypothetical protein
MAHTDAGKLSALDMARGHLTLAELHMGAGRPAEAHPLLLQAQSELETVKAQGNNGPDLRAQLIAVHAWLGRRDDVERELAEQIAHEEKDHWIGPLSQEDAVHAYLILGEQERALSILEKLLAQQYADALTPTLVRLDPLCDSLRANPRFQKLVGDKP